MHQRERLKSKHQAQQKENKKEVSKTSQENESLLTAPGERFYKDNAEEKCSSQSSKIASQRELIHGF